MQHATETSLRDLIDTALAAGAESAEAFANSNTATTAVVRLGKLEKVSRSEAERWSLRVWIGSRSAALSANDLALKSARGALVDKTLAMARVAIDDPFGGLAPPELIRAGWDEGAQARLDLYDPTEIDAAHLEALGREAEEAALSVRGITNSDGGSACIGCSRSSHVTSDGLVDHSLRSSFSIGVTAIAGDGAEKETDAFSHRATWLEDLYSPQAIGTEAATRAAARLGSRKLTSTRAPVIFERRTADRLLDAFRAAISGPQLVRGASFLKDRLGQRVFPSNVRIVDDPTLVRLMDSRTVDGEGVRSVPRALVDDGILTSWMLNAASARKLGLTPNGYGHSSWVAPSNMFVAAGSATLAELMDQAGSGLLVTSTFGPSINPYNGDCSIGVSGLWFERGQPAYPVNEITVAGSLPEFFARVFPGADLDLHAGCNSPSLLIDAVTIAGA